MNEWPKSQRIRSRFPTRAAAPAFLLAAIVFAAGAPTARAAYPQAADSYVNDFADVLSPDQETRIRTLLSDLKRDHGIAAVVVTVPSWNAYATGDPSMESFATGLFNAWGIGDRSRNDGVLILMARQDRMVRIELGSGYGASFDSKMQAIINGKMIPRFKANQYGQGLLDGARAVAAAVGGGALRNAQRPASKPAKAASAPARLPAEAIPGTPRPAPARVAPGRMPAELPPGQSLPPRAVSPPPFDPRSLRPPRSSQGSEIVGYLAAIGAAALVLFVLFRVVLGLGRKPRCPTCQIDMACLDEVSDDVYLDSGQKLEEALDTVDYDVWKCPTCGMHTVEKHPRLFSSYSRCPECGYRTLSAESETLMHPTRHSTGRKRIVSTCRNCHHQEEHVVILPILVDTDSGMMHGHGMGGSSHTNSGSHHSSGGSFGGGKSSGGGASGSW
ncbi:MAG: TPM domain-containing protein [Candidatus Sumerlaeota bacterium]|nr:TPM domain-containing protein [Candidatus Sumerlaeota bacterium]